MNQKPDDQYLVQDSRKSKYDRPNDPFVEVPAGPVRPYRKLVDGSFGSSEEDQLARKPSLRRRRFVLSICFTAFTVGSLLILLSSPYSNGILAPGPLHSSHAQLLAVQGTDRCSACHTAAASSLTGWIAHAFSGASSNVTQSQLCLECHTDSMDSQFALNPHNVDPAVLAARSDKSTKATLLAGFKISPVDSNNEIACSACHREHKGNQDLKALTDAQCQTCHQENYHSFETDHPDFTNWPEASRQNIAFDHTSHSFKHFPGAKEVFDCKRCHMDDNFNDVKTQVPFEKACASCHEQGIIDSGLDGFALVSLPMLDMRAIEAAKLDVQSWPVAATGDFDGQISPAMRTLLMADEAAKEVLLRRSPSFEFSDLDPDVNSDVQDAVTLVWSVKRLLHGLAVDGKFELIQRLEKVLDRTVDEAKMSLLIEGLDASAFAAAGRRWLPYLDQEMRAGFGNPPVSDDVADLYSAQRSLARINPQDELAENPLSSGVANEGKASANLKLSLELDAGSSLAESRKETAADEPPASRTEIEMPRTSSGAAKSPGQVPIFDGKRKMKDDIRSGWIRDDQNFSILYRPAGHDDLLLKHWIDAVTATPNADLKPEMKELFASLTSSNSIGNCRYCHTVKRRDDQSLVMNWKAERRDPSLGQFTSFSHRPHLIQPELKDCTHCHQMNSEVSNAASFASLNECDYQSNFHALSKSACVKCHQKGLTSNSCTLCHGYHVGGHKSQ